MKIYACHTDASLHNANVGGHGYLYPVGAHLFGRVHPRRQSGSPRQPSLTGAYICFKTLGAVVGRTKYASANNWYTERLVDVQLYL